jgi:hypothetical protein
MTLNNNQKAFMALCSNAIHNHNHVVKDFEIHNVFKLASEQSIWPMVFHSLSENPSFSDLKKCHLEFIEQCEHQFKSMMNHQMRKISLTRELLQLFHKNNIDVVYLKGYSLSLLYPNPLLRFSTDIDLLVDVKELDRTLLMLQTEGFSIGSIIEKSHHVVCYRDDIGRLEIHTQLFQSYESFKWFSLDFAFHKKDFQIMQSIIGEINVFETNIYSEYLIHHFIKHFLKSGIGIRQLIDILLFLKFNSEKIDWNELQNKLNKNGFEVFFHHLLRIGIDHLGFEENDFYITLNPSTNLTEDLLLDLLHAGAFGHHDEKRTEFYYNLDQNFNDIDFSKNRFKWQSFFPTYNQLINSTKYSYLKDYPLLYPTALFWRGILGLFKVFNNPNNLKKVFIRNPYANTPEVKQRVQLINNLGIKFKVQEGSDV